MIHFDPFLFLVSNTVSLAVFDLPGIVMDFPSFSTSVLALLSIRH
jgi:hypothetical protein